MYSLKLASIGVARLVQYLEWYLGFAGVVRQSAERQLVRIGTTDGERMGKNRRSLFIALTWLAFRDRPTSRQPQRQGATTIVIDQVGGPGRRLPRRGSPTHEQDTVPGATLRNYKCKIGQQSKQI